jgi:hypothetical protein
MALLHLVIKIILVKLSFSASVLETQTEIDNNITRYTDASNASVNLGNDNYQKLKTFFVDTNKILCYNKNLPVFYIVSDSTGKNMPKGTWLTAHGKLVDQNEVTNHCSLFKKYIYNFFI